MSEKRFSLQSFYPSVAPLKKEYFISDIENEYDSIRSLGDCVYVLNSLAEEIEELKLENKNECLKMENEEHKDLIEKRWGEYMQKKFKENEEWQFIRRLEKELFDDE